jgi:DNA replication protein DnaC
MLDDIGKGRLTPTAEELLFDIIDQRTERMKPIIWTSNMNASGLQKAFSDDRANPLLRRLSEFTKIISI